jgi:hypothetical protein
MVTTIHSHTTFAFVFIINYYLSDDILVMKMDDSLVCVYVNMMTSYLHS